MTSEETLKQFNLRKTKIRVAVLDSLSQSTVAQSYSTMQNALHEFDELLFIERFLRLPNTD